MTQKFDVIIVGGGMTGASLALLLAPAMAQGLSVALIETHALSAQTLTQPSFDDRTTALSLSTKRIFDKLGIWKNMAQQASAIQHIQVSQQKQLGRIRLHAADENVEAMGYVVENRIMGQQLMTAMLNLSTSVPATLTLFAPAQVKTYEVNAQGAQLIIDHEGEEVNLQAQLLVLADGANSEGCLQLGIAQTRHDYGQNALVCNISFDRPHEHWAFERFTQQGPMALLPMTNNRFALVWCMSKKQSEEYSQLDDDGFKQVLQTAVGHKVGRLNRVGERLSYPLNLVLAKEQIRSNVVVLGNAAHAMHPVAGQGFNLALRDAQALARQITTHFEVKSQDKKMGSLEMLQQYLMSQQADQKITVGLSHGLPKTFMQPGTGWSLLRALGMNAMDVSPVAKKLFTRQAMGLVGTADVWRP